MEEALTQNHEQNRLVWAAQALRNLIRLQIYELLTVRNSCSFNDLMQNLNISQPKLAYHLQIMQKYNIITNFYDKREGMKDHSFYELSNFGRELLAGVTAPVQLAPSNNLMPEGYPNDENNVNFRTIRSVRYRSYSNLPTKKSKNAIIPVAKKDRKYIDPLLDCMIITKSAANPKPKKIHLQSFRKYYLSYKRPFKSHLKIEPKY